MVANTNTEYKSYPLSRTWRIATLCLLVLMIAMLVAPPALGANVKGDMGGWLAFAGFCMFMVAMMLWLYVSRVVTSTAGIGSSNPFWHTFTPWENIVGLHQAPEAASLILADRLQGREPWTRFLLGLGISRVVQISPFIDNWHTSPLVADIRAHLPELSAELAQTATPIGQDVRGERSPIPFYASILGQIIYLLLCAAVEFLFLYIERQVLPLLPVGPALSRIVTEVWRMASNGWLGAFAIGFFALRSYNAALNRRTAQDSVARIALVQALIPPVGFVTSLIVAGLIYLVWSVSLGRPVFFSPVFLDRFNLLMGFVVGPAYAYGLIWWRSKRMKDKG